MSDQRYLTVNALTKYIKRKFDADPHLHDIYVRGEISNFKQHSSGHMYFTLKDEKARILAVMFSSANRRMKFLPEDGMNVLVRGEITVYEPSGQYQIYVRNMQPDGIGDLFLAYEQLKEKLEKEGLFLVDHKKGLPKYPKKIGVITSPTGAAIRDILTTIERRYPIGKVLIIPALVQGEQAAPSIVKAIKTANEIDELDILILGRGGGSIEELWAFNEEIVARAIFASKIPIISAVGHETDFTIADFVADLRAPTPTGAAEIAVPHFEELIERVLTNKGRLIRAMQEKLSIQRERLNRLEKSYAFRYPHKLYEQKYEQLDRLTEQLVRKTKRMYEQKTFDHETMRKQLNKNHPKKLKERCETEYQRVIRSLQKEIRDIFTHKQKDFVNLISTIEALSPLKIMERGYSVAYSSEGKIVKNIKGIKKSDQISVRLSDGKLDCEVIKIEGSDHFDS
ncbi:exodeoxyribonuclease VII large subunit [Bacillus aquiflavi]|uniref:Exodeoxyribonuclease 7 large subunit n=1 Tax=Bacillus aquiflavi TaxID=2672567 RepID=A0A6B3VXS0_9BACI|nr:exodeoxyribonuclease VII large subunit [Bacillus aquiflavi]MBA4535768.1 exodeoxyribonuclease VII large subunit [Bacillus aquiflavi]NEY80144.1 exodeoxyribonuclease VII large subunit [Bacillus aquiflavi]UAC47200.1 exodeoxyribonuclease VII large subunit [Bacillus aquiflavi]